MLHIGGHRNTEGVDCFFYLIPQMAPYYLDGPKGTYLTMHFSSLLLKVGDRERNLFLDCLEMKSSCVHEILVERLFSFEI